MDYEKILDNMGKVGSVIFASIFLLFSLSQLIRGCIDGRLMPIFAFTLLSYLGICLVRTTIHSIKRQRNDNHTTND